LPASPVPEGQFALSGPSEKLDPSRWPVRGDLAHVALAGRLFVPHYAVPQPRRVKAGGATLRKSNDGAAEILQELPQGYTFDVLDVQGNWAWGICNGLEGPIGYIAVEQLEQPE
jgi:hypothetical protein